MSVRPQFVFHPLLNVTGTFEWIWFWRESTKDAFYTFGNVPLRPANLSNARYVGSQPNLEIRWATSEHFLAALNLAAGCWESVSGVGFSPCDADNYGFLTSNDFGTQTASGFNFTGTFNVTAGETTAFIASLMADCQGGYLAAPFQR